jgi:hypothetical protein
LRNRYRGLGIEDEGSRFARISISALAEDRQRGVCHSASYFNG